MRMNRRTGSDNGFKQGRYTPSHRRTAVQQDDLELIRINVIHYILNGSLVRLSTAVRSGSAAKNARE